MNILFFSAIAVWAVTLMTRGRQGLGRTALFLGILFPVDVLGSVNPFFIDMLRYVLVLVLIISLQALPRHRSNMAIVAATLLLCINFIVTARGLLAEHTGLVLQSLIGIISVVLAYLVTRSACLNRKMLIGFLFGTTWSALDIILQVVGLPYLGTATEWGTRYPGLGATSTNTAPFLALGLVLVISNFLWKRSTPWAILRIGSAVLLATGLLLSGGRGGLAGIALAIAIFLVTQLRNRPMVVTFFVAVAAAWILTKAPQIRNFLTRDGSDSGFATGRDVLNALAWEAFLRGGPLGIDLAKRSEYRPHTPILSFTLNAGAVGLVVTLILTGFLLWRLLQASNRTTAATSALVRMMASVIFVTTLLEPWGFFLGLAKGIILMMVYGLEVDDYASTGSKRLIKHHIDHREKP